MALSDSYLRRLAEQQPVWISSLSKRNNSLKSRIIVKRTAATNNLVLSADAEVLA
jgi:hypothetical protein